MTTAEFRQHFTQAVGAMVHELTLVAEAIPPHEDAYTALHYSDLTGGLSSALDGINAALLANAGGDNP